jgi:hypothetical protein
MLFSEQRTTAALGQDSSAQRHLLLAELLVAFQSSFPEVQYQIFPKLDLLNGQALILGAQRIVRLYGGVALHPAMGRDGLAFALLHETGHHLSVGTRLPWNPLIACECAADFWAFNVGREMLANSAGWTVDIAKALDEVSALIETKGTEEITPKTGERDPCDCWAKCWDDRRASILEGISIPSDHSCPLNYEILGLGLNGDQ